MVVRCFRITYLVDSVNTYGFVSRMTEDFPSSNTTRSHLGNATTPSTPSSKLQGNLEVTTNSHFTYLGSEECKIPIV
jgi:hypothetical protein